MGQPVHVATEVRVQGDRGGIVAPGLHGKRETGKSTALFQCSKYFLRMYPRNVHTVESLLEGGG